METKQKLLTLNGKEYLLDIEQAEKLGLLKEKGNKVRSWKECETKYKPDIVYGFHDVLGLEKYPGKIGSTHTQITPHEAKALAAFSKLLKLRRDWIGEWEPDFTTSDMKWVLYCRTNDVICDWCKIVGHVLSFPTEQMAKEFLETFRDLIEEAKILI